MTETIEEKIRKARKQHICDDYHDGCWWDCKTNHHCNADAYTCAPDKEDVMRWLKSEVKVDGDM